MIRIYMVKLESDFCLIVRPMMTRFELIVNGSKNEIEPFLSGLGLLPEVEVIDIQCNKKGTQGFHKVDQLGDIGLGDGVAFNQWCRMVGMELNGYLPVVIHVGENQIEHVIDSLNSAVEEDLEEGNEFMELTLEEFERTRDIMAVVSEHIANCYVIAGQMDFLDTMDEMNMLKDWLNHRQYN